MKIAFKPNSKNMLSFALLIMLLPSGLFHAHRSGQDKKESYPAVAPVQEGVYRLADNPRIWYVKDNTYRLVESPQALFAHGFTWADVQPLDQNLFAVLLPGENLNEDKAQKFALLQPEKEQALREEGSDDRQKLASLGIALEGTATNDQYQMAFAVLRHMPNVQGITLRFEDGSIACGGKNLRAYGCAVPSARTIRLNTQLPDRYVSGVVAHEYGHLVESDLSFPKEAPIITRYGARNKHENFAEHFAAYVLEGNRYRQLAITDAAWQKNYSLFFSYFGRDFSTGNALAFHPQAIYLSTRSIALSSVAPVSQNTSQ